MGQNTFIKKLENIASGLTLALTFLTSLPAGGGKDRKIILSRAVPFFSTVGFVIGSILIGVHILLQDLLPLPVIVGIILIALFAITRGIHLDGLADTFDGLLGATDPIESLRIMADSKLGAFGIIAIVLDLLLKFLLINSFNQKELLVVLLFFPALARTVASFAVSFYSPAKDSGLGKEFTQGRNPLYFFYNIVIVLIPLIAIFQLEGLLILIYQLFLGILLVTLLTLKVKGITGDILGAIIEISEIIALMILMILIN